MAFDWRSYMGSEIHVAPVHSFHQIHKDEDEDEKDDDNEEEKEDGDENDGPRCPGCSKDCEECQCEEILKTFHQVNQQLYELGLLERVSSEAVTSIIQSKIEHHIKHTCKGEFESSFIEPLEKCEPVRKYLRTREDTVRCIVSSLTDDGSSELADELVKGEPLLMDENYYSDEENGDPETWQPDPIDADPAKTSKSRRSSDIISMLVNIYGSRELFVNEYRTLLADRILSSFNYDTAREIRYLELLKLRFGESQLHYCEVMLKDVADSKRINTHIKELKDKEEKEKTEKNVDLNTMILSAQFWPSFREEKLDYKMLLSQKLLLNTWTINELSSVMKVPVTALRRKMAFWQSQGVLKEQSTDTFVLIEERPGGRGSHEVMIIDSDEETESAMASAQDQREEELQVFWSYIVGMLTNLESLPLERIYSMLKMFAIQGPMSTIECSEEELRHFLDSKVKEQKLVFSGSVYRLPKGTS
uniref:Anaphase-promoting complex subunit 2 n=1 Tax=Saccoglossus kowalevskii TaxID=10224 RepID=A0ABM0MEI0_SACKO|nr:PREDICTED: anaphase-promoting complex subunit 2-like [Saccoglossus kowalevskii]